MLKIFTKSPTSMLNNAISIWLTYLKLWNYYTEDCGRLRRKNIHISFCREACIPFKRTVGLAMQPSYNEHETASKFIENGLPECGTHKGIHNSWLGSVVVVVVVFEENEVIFLEYSILSYKAKIVYQIHSTAIT